MKTILLPTDFSDNAWNAIFTALKLFYDHQCQFVLIHTYQPDLANVLGDHGEKRLGVIYESMEEESRIQMKKITDYLRTHHKNPRHQFKTLCRPGDLINVVKQQMESHPADMIVIGTQGATGAKRVLLGSNTVRMFKFIKKRPVLAVPATFDFQRLRHVVFPTDYMHYYEKFEIQTLTDLVRDWKATLHVVYAAQEFELKPTQQSNKKLLKMHLEGLDTRFTEIPLEKHLVNSLEGYARSVRADLLVLMQHKHSFFETLTREKVVKRIAFDSPLPLLILPQFL